MWTKITNKRKIKINKNMILLYMPSKIYNNKYRFKTKTRILRKKNRRFRKSVKKQLGGGILDDALIKITDTLNILNRLQELIKIQLDTQIGQTSAKTYSPQEEQPTPNRSIITTTARTETTHQPQQQSRWTSVVDAGFNNILIRWNELNKQNLGKNISGMYKNCEIENIKYVSNDNCSSYFYFSKINPINKRGQSDLAYLKLFGNAIKRPSCYGIGDYKIEHEKAIDFFKNLVLDIH